MPGSSEVVAGVRPRVWKQGRGARLGIPTMPPTQSAAGKARKVRDVDYFQQQLKQLKELGEGNTIEFEADLKIFTTLQSEFVTLDKELKGFFSQIQQDNPGPFGKETVFMFKSTCGGEKNVWSFQREVAHRLEFLRMAQDSASNRMLFTEGCNAQPFDENLDKLMDFVILKGNGEQSLMQLVKIGWRKR